MMVEGEDSPERQSPGDSQEGAVDITPLLVIVFLKNLPGHLFVTVIENDIEKELAGLELAAKSNGMGRA